MLYIDRTSATNTLTFYLPLPEATYVIIKFVNQMSGAIKSVVLPANISTSSGYSQYNIDGTSFPNDQYFANGFYTYEVRGSTVNTSTDPNDFTVYKLGLMKLTGTAERKVYFDTDNLKDNAIFVP